MSDQPPPPPYLPYEEPKPASSHSPPITSPHRPSRLPPHNASSSTATSFGGSPSSRPSFSASQLSPYGSPAAPTESTAFLHDPRSSSQASLLPTTSGVRSSRRMLLLVYIHGFMGNETSFQSFPAHLHNLLTVTLGSDDDSAGYLVHTKVYPKFKTRHQINVATLEFSQWLSRFESETTDIVLIGHSMGGILAAEVVLLNSVYCPDSRQHPGILGIIAFDTPFLGMHPGIISSGIASLFRPAPSPSSAAEESNAESQLDPFFAQRPRKNFTVVQSKKPGNPWESTLHFIQKHHENLTQATGKYLMSHLEFGACLADPIGLKNRYARIRRLEDGEQTQDGRVDRVRFANYYTISYGREKTGEVVKPPEMAAMADDIIGGTGGSFGVVETGLEAVTAQLAVVGGGGNEATPRSHSRTPSGSSMGSMQELTPGSISNSSRPASAQSEYQSAQEDTLRVAIPKTTSRPSVEIVPPTPASPPPPPPDDVEALFPPLSAPPAEPTLPEIPESADKPLRKALEKEHKRLQKEHERQMKEYAKLAKAREKAIARVYKEREKERREDKERIEKEREKVRQKEQEKEREQEQEKERIEKQRQKEQEDKEKEAEKQHQELQKQMQKEEQEREKREKENAKKQKSPRQRKFCIVPSQPDKTWTPVEMKGVDEVGAHCGLFFVGEVYAKLVGDVAARIEEWVGEEQSRRLVAMEGGGGSDWAGGGRYWSRETERYGHGGESESGWRDEKQPGYSFLWRLLVIGADYVDELMIPEPILLNNVLMS
ncbi:hypothetical protein K440DRAFT_665205 [Wilcoxina mikolae CBS 423.85]|nr:hypothetical protein K440DRAFT_665205 [Wilcoxina mikolae CBS 423.85]